MDENDGKKALDRDDDAALLAVTGNLDPDAAPGDWTDADAGDPPKEEKSATTTSTSDDKKPAAKKATAKKETTTDD